MTQGGVMTGRNASCPCGSGRKFKKCCLHRNQTASSPKNSAEKSHIIIKNPVKQPLNFSGIISAEYAEDLPFIPMVNVRNMPKFAVEYLEKQTLTEAHVDIDVENKIYAKLVFHDQLDNCDSNDDDGYGYGYRWDYEDVIEVFLCEVTPAGPIKIDVFCNKKIVAPKDFSQNVNAAIIFVWVALSKAVAKKELPLLAQNFYKKYNDIPKTKKNLDRQFALIKEELKDVSLFSIRISLDPILADGTSIRNRDPDFKLPDQSGFKKTKNVQLLREELLSGGSTQLNQRRQNIPDSFFHFKSREKGYNSNSSHYLHRLTEAVQYCFSDGVIVSAHEILSTKYALLLPPDLLPGEMYEAGGKDFWGQKFSDVKANELSTDKDNLSELELVSQENNFIRFHNNEIKAVNEIMLKLTKRIAFRLNANEIKVELMFNDNSYNTVLSLSKIESSTADLYSWHPEYFSKPESDSTNSVKVFAQLSLQKNENLKDRLLPLRSGILSFESKTWYIKDINSMLYRFGTLESLSPKVSFKGWRDHVKCEISTWPDLAVTLISGDVESYNILKENLADENSYLGRLCVSSQLSTIKAKSELHLDSEGRFLLVRRLLSNETAFKFPYLHGLSAACLKILKTLDEGLPGFFGREAKELASQSRQKREFELKLLKHLGVLNLFIFEILSVRFQGAMSDGKMIKQVEEILPQLEKKILSLLGESTDLSLSDFCSKSVCDLLKKFLKKFNELIQPSHDKNDLRSRVLLCEGEFLLENAFEDELRLIYQVLSYSALTSGGDLFAKPRFSLLSKIFPFEEHRLGECHLQSRQSPMNLALLSDKEVHFQLPCFVNQRPSWLNTLGVFQPLLKFDFDFFINGQPIQELNDYDFQTELLLSEKSAEAEDINSSLEIEPQTGSINWFELNPKVFLYGTEISIQEAGPLLRDGIIEHKGRFYLIPAKRLPSLKRLSSFWDRLRIGKKSNPRQSLGEQVFQVPKSQILEMLALRTSGISVIGGKKWQDVCSFYDKLDTEQPSLQLPKTINAELKPYQRTGVQWLYELNRLGLGSVLADDMGLGKTLQTLAFLEVLRNEKNMGAVLIVVPTSLTYNWLSEKEKFVPNLIMQVFSVKAKEETLTFLTENPQSVVLTTYGLMHEHKEFFQNINWNIIIFDEAQNLKTITSQRTTTARSLNSHFKICLTGTPLENHLGEYYSIFDLAVPGCLGAVDEFRKVFVNSQSIHTEDLRYLKLKSKPLLLRRTKKQILSELPEKRESLVALDFESKQKKIYRDIAISYNEKIQETILAQGEGKCQLQMLTALLRLRQTCSDPSSLPGVKYEGIPPKLEALKEALFEIVESGESAIVFTQFLRTLERTENLLKAALLPTYTIHGGLTQIQREKVLREFNENKRGAILLMTLKTGGVGLNLTKASYVFHLEPWWNPAVENQATDRAHRLGQRRAVQVYRYIMHESVEEKIELLKKRKQLTFSSVFDDSENESLDLSRDKHDVTERQASRIDSSGSFLSKEDFNFLLNVN